MSAFIFDLSAPTLNVANGSVTEGTAYQAILTVTDPNGGAEISSGLAFAGFVLPNGSRINGAANLSHGRITVSADSNAAADAASVAFTYTAFDKLRAGQVITEVITASATDNAGRTSNVNFTLTLTGTNDAPTVTVGTAAPAQAEVAGTGSNPVTAFTGSLTINDKDVGDTLSGAVVPNSGLVTSSPGVTVPNDIVTRLLAGAITFGTPVTSNGGNRSLSFSYKPDGTAPLDLNFLAAGQTLAVTFQVQANDNSGGSSDPVSVTFSFTGSNDDPVLNAAPALSVTETSAFDTSFGGTQTGQLTATDVDGDTPLSYGIQGVVPVGTVSTLVGQFGILTVNADGSVSYAADAAKVNALLNDTTDTFTVTVSDGKGGSDSETLTVAIDAENDLPTFVAAPAAVTGLQEANNNGNTDLAARTGTLQVSDVESGQTLSVSPVAGSMLLLNGQALTTASGLGATAITALENALLTNRLSIPSATSTGGTVDLTYTYDAATANLNFLQATDTLTVRYILSATDGLGNSAQTTTLDIQVAGRNDAPTVGNLAPINIAEAADASNQTLSASGTINVTDLDIGNTLSLALNGTPTATYKNAAGTAINLPNGVDVSALIAPAALTLTPPASTTSTGAALSFSYSYSAAANLDFLTAGETLELVFNVRANDGTANSGNRAIRIVVAGTNDGPVVNTIGELVYTDSAIDDMFAVSNGTVTSADKDANDTVSYALLASVIESVEINGTLSAPTNTTPTVTTDASGTTVVTSAGTLSLTPTGAYTFTPNNTTFNAANQITVLRFAYEIQAKDGSNATDTDFLTIRLVGNNDTAEIAGDLTGNVTEDVTTAAISGTVTVSDRDLPNEATFKAVAPAALLGTYGSFTFNEVSGAWTYTLDNLDADTKALGATETGTDTLTLESADGTTQDLVITVQGSNDAPTQTAPTQYTEEGLSFTVSDVDGDTLSLVGGLAASSFVAPVTIGNGVSTQLKVQAQTVVTTGSVSIGDGIAAPISVGTLALGTDGSDGGNLLGGLNANGNAALYGFGGDDTLSGTQGVDHLYGGSGNDRLQGDQISVVSADVLRGGAGNDILVGDQADAVLDGGDDTDTLQVAGGFEDASDDQLTGLERVEQTSSTGSRIALDNQTEGFAVLGNNGADTLIGGSGNDSLNGGNGNDSLDGGAGHDTLRGAGGNDLLTGGEGDDVFESIEALDTVTGGNGNDRATVTVAYVNSNNARLDGVELIEAKGTITVNLTGQSEAFEIDGDAAIQSLVGGSGNDTLDGGDNADTLDGGAGDDVFIADSNDALIQGNAGNDKLLVVSGFVDSSDGQLQSITQVEMTAASTLNLESQTEAFTVDGSLGNDIIALNASANTADVVRAGDGDDTVYVGAGNNSVDGGLGNDMVIAGAGADTLRGGDGNDSLFASDGANRLFGDDGDDTLTVTTTTAVASSSLDGGAGNDTLNAAGGNDTLLGGEGNDSITAGDGANTVEGGAGDDTVSAGTGNDTLRGGEGNDELNAGGGANQVFGDAGNDVLTVADGTTIASSRLEGGEGNDTLTGATGNDTLLGGEGDDSVDGGNGNNTIEGGTGNDSLSAGTGNDTLRGGEGNDTLQAGGGANRVFGDDGDDVLIAIDTAGGPVANNSLEGGIGHDTLTGASGNDTLLGGDGNDSLVGGAGNDSLTAGAGADVIQGGDGNDTLTDLSELDIADGGAGTDTARIAGSYFITQDIQLEGFENLILEGGGFAISLGQQTEGFVITGNNNDHTITGGSGNDTILASGGNDTIDADDADATIDGGSGTDILIVDEDFNDTGNGQIVGVETVLFGVAPSGVNLNLDQQTEAFTIIGGGGDDTIVAGTGSDSITGGNGNDSLDGGNGNNTLDGGAGSDTLRGGTGTDTLVADQADALIDGGAGTSDTLLLRGGTSFVSASNDQLVNVERVTLEQASTLNLGNQMEAFIVTGSAGNDAITAGSGNDNLGGGAGDDTLTGGAGNDALNGNAGKDTFVFAASGNANGNDTISGFSPTSEVDVLDFSAFLSDAGTVVLDANLGGGTDDFDPFLANPGVATNIHNKVVSVVSTATTANSLAVALGNNGVFSNLDLGAGEKAVILAATSVSPATIRVFFLDGGVAANQITLVGMVNATGSSLDALTAANILA